MLFENLESRCLLSGTLNSALSDLPMPTSAAPVVTSAGEVSTLTVTGTDGNDAINVSLNADGDLVVTEIVFEPADSTATTATSGRHRHGPRQTPVAYRQTTITDDVDKVVINAGAGDDNVLIGRYRGSFTTPVTINGGEGDDHLSGGAGADTINGDAGDDWISGAAGNDTLNGGADDDFIAGDAGDDVIHGNDGADHISGGRGADSLFGDAGNDRIDALDGAADTVIDGGANDTPTDDEPGDTAVVDSLDQADTSTTPSTNHVSNVEDVTVPSSTSGRFHGPRDFGFGRGFGRRH